jgi:hypothetical protein
MTPLHQAALIARLVRDMGGDDDAVDISVASETDAYETVDAILAQIGEAEAQAAVCDLRAAELTERKSMHLARRDRLRGVLLQFMTETGLKTLRRAEATLSVTAGKPTVVKEGDFDVSRLSPEFVRTKTEPDMSAIRRAVLEGRAVPGVVKSNNPPSLALRRA